jgi:hypothetical protein
MSEHLGIDPRHINDNMVGTRRSEKSSKLLAFSRPLKGLSGRDTNTFWQHSILGIIYLCNPLSLLPLLLGITLFELLLRLQLPSSSPLLRFASKI